MLPVLTVWPFVIAIQVSFAPVRAGRYTARLTVLASRGSSRVESFDPQFQTVIPLTATAETASIQVIHRAITADDLPVNY